MGEFDDEKFMKIVQETAPQKGNKKKMTKAALRKKIEAIDKDLLRNPDFTPFIEKTYGGGEAKEVDWSDPKLLEVSVGVVASLSSSVFQIVNIFLGGGVLHAVLFRLRRK